MLYYDYKVIKKREIKRGENLSEEMKKNIEEVTDVLKCLNSESLATVKGFSLGLQASQEIKTEQPQCVEK